MSPDRVWSLVVVLFSWAAAAPSRATAQLYPPLPARYTLTADVRDARAVWVNPAGLALGREASVGADATLDRTSGALRLAQYGLTFQSANLGFGWSRSSYPGGAAANAFVLAAGLGDEALSAGVSRRWFRGGRSARAWDLALRSQATATTDLSLVWRLIGSPLVRDTVLRRWPAGIIPGAGMRLFGGVIYASAEAELETDLSGVREVRAGATITPSRSLSVTLRGDFARGFARRGFAVAVTWRRAGSRLAVATLLPAGAGALDAIGALGAVVAAPRSTHSF